MLDSKDHYEFVMAILKQLRIFQEQERVEFTLEYLQMRLAANGTAWHPEGLRFLRYLVREGCLTLDVRQAEDKTYHTITLVERKEL